MSKRVFVGCFFHESHGFNPYPSGPEQFEILRGEALAQAARRQGTTMGGMARRLEELGYQPVPGLLVSAAPSGLVQHDFYLAMRDELIALAREAACDAIALELHGAMGTTELADAEGDLLAHLRAAIGPHVPIGVGLDLHGHITPAMLENTDICIACKENPHADVVECGEKVATLLDEMLRGKLTPVSVLVKTRMLLPGAGDTAFGPLHDLHAQARAMAAADPSIRDISLYNVFRYLDDWDIGQAAVVLTDGKVGEAAGLATTLAEGFWARREEFRDDLLSIDEALDRVAEDKAGRPFVLADMGDRVLAGAPGDSTAILRRLLERGLDLKAAIPLTDPVGVAAAVEAGPGAVIDIAIGGRFTPGFEPFSVRAEVLSISDGVFSMRGPYRAGERTSLGRAVTLRIGNGISVLLTAKPGFTHDPAAFESQGIAMRDQDLIVVKSGYHFTLNFKGIATPLLVATPGIGYYVQGFLPWKKARFWPEHDVTDAPVMAPQVFAHQG